DSNPLSLSLVYLMNFFLRLYGHHPDLHSFPTRRSSDLSNERIPLRKDSAKELPIAITSPVAFICVPNRISAFVNLSNGNRGNFRSEEHTSELQSRENLVCRLLLEKKKKKIKQNKSIYRS